jgi:hypothetical protein
MQCTAEHLFFEFYKFIHYRVRSCPTKTWIGPTYILRSELYIELCQATDETYFFERFILPRVYILYAEKLANSLVTIYTLKTLCMVKLISWLN